MYKENFLSELQNSIIKHPEWSGEAILAICSGISKIVNNAQEKINIAELFFKSVSKIEQKRLKKRGISTDKFNELNNF